MSEKLPTASGAATQWRTIPVFSQSVFEGSVREQRVDYPRSIAVLLAINFLPLVLLWKWSQVSAFVQRNRKRLFLTLLVFVLLALVLGGVAYWMIVQEARASTARQELSRKNLEERRNAEYQMRQYNNRLPSGFTYSPTPKPQTQEHLLFFVQGGRVLESAKQIDYRFHFDIYDRQGNLIVKARGRWPDLHDEPNPFADLIPSR